jgi:hypothetical protein
VRSSIASSEKDRGDYHTALCRCAPKTDDNRLLHCAEIQNALAHSRILEQVELCEKTRVPKLQKSTTAPDDVTKKSVSAMYYDDLEF